MVTKTVPANGLAKIEADYLGAIEENLREMAAIHRSMKKSDADSPVAGLEPPQAGPNLGYYSAC
jgi:hypothetical protein